MALTVFLVRKAINAPHLFSPPLPAQMVTTNLKRAKLPVHSVLPDTVVRTRQTRPCPVMPDGSVFSAK